ncbi:hypothetical protein [Halorubellus salinus]|uniref:hypothetical protein n=1 Tax=Halorubellus salinus TaxID=755309 RepID=UPI001D06A841|nr:hypothetical protein [Halorubellus salinus]
MEVENQDDDTHAVSIRITAEDASEAFAETVVVEAGHSSVFHEPVDVGTADTVHAALGEDRIEASLESYATENRRCVRIVIRITSDGDLAVTGEAFDDC